MDATPDSLESQRLRLAIELHDAGLAISLERIKREHPGISEEAASELLRESLQNRPVPTFAPAQSYLA